MNEFVIDAIVLYVFPTKEFDSMAYFFTKEFGKIKVRVIGNRKILSKFSPHLNPMNLVTIRIVKKNVMTLTDILTKNKFKRIKLNVEFYEKSLKILKIIHKLVPEELPDKQLWYYLINLFKKGMPEIEMVLKIIGYDMLNSRCMLCKNREIVKFSRGSQGFLCKKCSMKFLSDDVVYIR